MSRWSQFVAGMVAVVLMAGCVPKFPSGAQVNVVAQGSGARLSWPAAEEIDAGQTIGSYRVDVDGAEVARVAGTRRACDLVGLTAGPHEVAITAYDTTGEWSGTAASRLVATVQPPEPAAAGSVIACEVAGAEDLVPGLNAIYPVLSDDGRFVAFVSDTPSAPGDTPGTFDVFVHDRITGASTQVTNGDRSTLRVTIAGGGRYLVFESDATNLMSVPPIAGTNVYSWDRLTGELVRLPFTNFAVMFGNVVSDDGRFVAAMVSTGVHFKHDVVRWDRQTGAIDTRQDPRQLSPVSDISSDGRYVVYGATELVGSSLVRTLVRWDAQDGSAEEIAVPGRGSWESPAMSDDGAVAVFTTQVFNAPEEWAVWVWERATGQFTDLTQLGGGIHSWRPIVSDDGRYVAMTIDGPSVIEPNGAFVWDRTTRTLATVNTDGPAIAEMTMSGDASTVVYERYSSGARHLFAVPGPAA